MQTNQGSPKTIPKYPWIFLFIFAIIDIITGSIHFFAPDGGAGTIAHFDLVPGVTATTEIIYLFALLGTCQIGFAMLYLYFVAKKQDMVPIGLFLVAFLNGVGIVTNFFFKAPMIDFPFKYKTIIFFALSVVILIALKRKRD